MTPEEIYALPYRPCVGLMVCNPNGGIFAGQRIDSAKDAWQMPQGGVEKGENPRDAALRELEEETGIPAFAVNVVAETQDWIPYDLPHQLVPKLWKGRYRGQKQRWFLLRFAGDDSLINIETKHPEFSSWRWLEPEELLANIVPFKKDTYLQVIREFQAQIT
ncbi:MAG: RNA pyrophosphohydrolase [Rhodobacteraceae bacterium]|nr:RNA pyrophosphohydrolase [Paracoccaceae bacterium]